VVNLPEGEPIAGGGRRRSGLQLLEAIDEVAIVTAPGRGRSPPAAPTRVRRSMSATSLGGSRMATRSPSRSHSPSSASYESGSL
jgi:hypothetical protein